MNFDKFVKLLNEDAIDNFGLEGNWDDNAPRYGFDEPSTKILTNPIAVEKIKKKWEKTDYNFDLYFVRSKDATQYSEWGRVPEEFVRNKLKVNVPINRDSITVFYVNNKGDEKVPMTAWTIAHRFGHSLSRSHREMPTVYQRDNHFFNEFTREVRKAIIDISGEVYGRKIDPNQNKKLGLIMATALCTFKSARDNNIRNYNEVHYELIAQYILTGKITLNRNLPNPLPIKKAWGRTSGYSIKNFNSEIYEDLEEVISHYEDSIGYTIDVILGSNIGNIYVM